MEWKKITARVKKLNLLPDSLPLFILVLCVLATEAILIFIVALLDILPGRYLLALFLFLAAADGAMLFLVGSKKKHTLRRLGGTAVCFAMMIMLTAGVYYLGNTFDTLAKITHVASYKGTSKVTTEPFNMYISGIDSREDISDDAARSDVNMILTVDPVNFEILMTSMPRDSYVPLHMNGEMDKLTHTGVYGIDETVSTVEDWLDIDIDYYARVDFNMLVNLVDAVGGVTVYNHKDFYSSPKGWHYTKGWKHMDGKKALWFVRERKAFKDEDEQRIRNQQKVMKALIQKVSSSKTLMTNYTQILDVVEENMQTNLSRSDISELAKMQLAYMPKWTIRKQWVDGVDAERGTWSMGPNRPLFVSLPKEKSVEKVSSAIKAMMTSTGKEE